MGRYWMSRGVEVTKLFCESLPTNPTLSPPFFPLCTGARMRTGVDVRAMETAVGKSSSSSVILHPSLWLWLHLTLHKVLMRSFERVSLGEKNRTWTPLFGNIWYQLFYLPPLSLSNSRVVSEALRLCSTVLLGLILFIHSCLPFSATYTAQAKIHLGWLIREVIKLNYPRPHSVFFPEKQEGREDRYLNGAQRFLSWIEESFQEWKKMLE